MRIALCLSGQPRFLRPSCQHVQENILRCNADTDIFIHSWYDPRTVGQEYDSAQPHQTGHVGRVERDADLFIKEQLNPRISVFEPQRSFAWANELRSHDTAIQEKLVSMFFSMYTANKLKKEYETQHGFVYDCVIRARLDIFYFHPIDFSIYEDLIKDHIVTSKRFQDIRMSNNSLTDIFAFSNSRFMNVFCDTFLHYARINQVVAVPFGEDILGHHVRVDHKIPIKTVDLEYEIMHRVLQETTA